MEDGAAFIAAFVRFRTRTRRGIEIDFYTGVINAETDYSHISGSFVVRVRRARLR
jgi:hypothetical protein